MGTSLQSTAQKLHDELTDQAVEHKKLERRSRNLAQRTYATLRELEELCESLGIPVVKKAARDE